MSVGTRMVFVYGMDQDSMKDRKWTVLVSWTNKHEGKNRRKNENVVMKEATFLEEEYTAFVNRGQKEPLPQQQALPPL